MEVRRWSEAAVSRAGELEADRVRTGEIDSVGCENGLEHLRGSLLSVEANDLVGNLVARLYGADGGEVGVGELEEDARARPQVDL